MSERSIEILATVKSLMEGLGGQNDAASVIRMGARSATVLALAAGGLACEKPQPPPQVHVTVQPTPIAVSPVTSVIVQPAVPAPVASAPAPIINNYYYYGLVPDAGAPAVGPEIPLISGTVNTGNFADQYQVLCDGFEAANPPGAHAFMDCESNGSFRKVVDLCAFGNFGNKGQTFAPMESITITTGGSTFVNTNLPDKRTGKDRYRLSGRSLSVDTPLNTNVAYEGKSRNSLWHDIGCSKKSFVIGYAVNSPKPTSPNNHDYDSGSYPGNSPDWTPSPGF